MHTHTQQVALGVVVSKLLLTFISAPGDTPAALGVTSDTPFVTGDTPFVTSDTELVASGSFYMAMVGVVDIAFSFGGQINW